MSPNLFNVALGLSLGAVPAVAGAFEIGYSEYRWFSELAAENYQLFPSSGQTGELFGMSNSKLFYLCYPVDHDIAAEMRHDQMRAEVNGAEPDRKVQNLPLACVQLR